MAKTFALFAAATLLALGGCSANHHSIYRHQAMDTPSLTAVDAKQRVILAAEPSASASVKTPRFCAEPSPDVFAVIAQALSAGGSLGQSADPKSLQLAMNAAFSSSEQGATIPRTQTINMLRELMYRTCERYLSGGIGDDELSLQAIRDQRLIVSILAIEQLTGMATPKPVVIGASASGGSGASGTDAAIRLDDQFKNAQKKSDALAKKQAAYDELNGTAKDCETIDKAVADKKEGDLSQALKDKRAKCEAASAELDAAKKEKVDADAHYKALAAVASNGGIPVVVAGSLMTPVAAGGVEGAQTAAIAQVAATVGAIVADTFNQDEFLFFCLKSLKGDQKLSEVRKNCLEYVQSGVDFGRVRNEAKAAEISMATERIRERSGLLFNDFWKLVSVGGQLDEAKLAAVQKEFNPKDWPACFAGAKSKAEFQACFESNAVVAHVKRALAKGKSNG